MTPSKDDLRLEVLITKVLPHTHPFFWGPDHWHDEPPMSASTKASLHQVLSGQKRLAVNATGLWHRCCCPWAACGFAVASQLSTPQVLQPFSLLPMPGWLTWMAFKSPCCISFPRDPKAVRKALLFASSCDVQKPSQPKSQRGRSEAPATWARAYDQTPRARWPASFCRRTSSKWAVTKNPDGYLLHM